MTHEWSKRVCIGQQSCKALPTVPPQLPFAPAQSGEMMKTFQLLNANHLRVEYGAINLKVESASLVNSEGKVHRKGREEWSPVGISLPTRPAFGWDEQGEKNILRENSNLDGSGKGFASANSA